MAGGWKPVRADEIAWDDTYDVVVVGAGAAGFPAALNAAARGSSVAILEKASEPGGTMKKSAAWYWIPNNSFMREDGKVDEKAAFLRYCARLARPQAYSPSGDHYGLSEWEYDTLVALYDNASIAERPTRRDRGDQAALLARHPGLPLDHPGGRGAVRSDPPDRPGRRRDGQGRRPDRAATRRLREARRAGSDGPPGRDGGRRRRRRRRRRPRRTGERPTRLIQARAGRDLRHRRVHAQRGASAEFPARAGLQRLRGADERGRLRPHRDRPRAAAAEHELRVDVPDPVRDRDGEVAVPERHVLGRRRLDDLGRQVRQPRRQREDDLQRARHLVPPVRPAQARVPAAAHVPDLGPARDGRLPGDRGDPVDAVEGRAGQLREPHLRRLPRDQGRDARRARRRRSRSGSRGYEQQTGGFRLDESFRANLPRSIARFNELAADRARTTTSTAARTRSSRSSPASSRRTTTRATRRCIRSRRQGPYYAALVCAGTLDTKGGPYDDATARCSTRTGIPSRGSTRSATASPTRPRRRISPAAARSARTSRSRTSPRSTR